LHGSFQFFAQHLIAYQILDQRVRDRLSRIFLVIAVRWRGIGLKAEVLTISCPHQVNAAQRKVQFFGQSTTPTGDILWQFHWTHLGRLAVPVGVTIVNGVTLNFCSEYSFTRDMDSHIGAGDLGLELCREIPNPRQRRRRSRMALAHN
jgi:hypothetical protein